MKIKEAKGFFKNKALILDSNYEWVIVSTGFSYPLLVPLGLETQIEVLTTFKSTYLPRNLIRGSLQKKSYWLSFDCKIVKYKDDTLLIYA